MRPIVIVYLLLFAAGVRAQSFVNEGATVYVAFNTELSLGDSVINRGHMLNEGVIYLTGSWLNEGLYTPGIGRVILNSAGQQMINHNAQIFGELTISGGGDKFFEEDIFINTTVSLENGRLVSMNNARLIVEENGTITGGSDLSYVVGEVVQKNRSEMNFPVGLMSAFLPVTLTGINALETEVGVYAYEPQELIDPSGKLEEVSDLQYWSLNSYDSDFDGAFVQLAINNENLNGSFDRVVVAEALDLSSSFRSLGQSTISGNFTSGIVTSEAKATGQVLAIGVENSNDAAEVNIYNAVSPNGDGKHEFLNIENIEIYPENIVTVYAKDGREVFEIKGYNNIDRVFVGQSNKGQLGNLPSGTYYYIIERGAANKKLKGYFLLSR